MSTPYIYYFRELKNKTPSLNLAEAYNLFMHGLNPPLCQLVGTMVTSGNLEEVIEIVKKATVYTTMIKVDLLQIEKLKTNKKGRVEVKVVAREVRAIGNPSGGPKGKVQIISGDSQQEAAASIVMIVTGGANTSEGKTTKPNKQGKGSKGKQRRKPPPAYFLCGEKHIVKNYPQWQAVLETTKKSGNGKPGPHNP